MATQLDRSITTLINDGGIAHAIVHGGPTEIVQTEGGPVRTFAKLIADNQAAFDQAAEDLTAIGTNGGAALVGTADGSDVQAKLDAVPGVASAAVTAGVDALKAEYAAPTGAGDVGSAAQNSPENLPVEMVLSEWINLMRYIPPNEHDAMYAGTSTYNLSPRLAMAGAICVLTGKGLSAPYFRKGYLADGGDLSGIRNVYMPGDFTLASEKTLTIGAGAQGGVYNITIGDVTNGTSLLNAAPPTNPVLRIAGIKSSTINIGSCNYTQVWADDSGPATSSNAYFTLNMTGVQSKLECKDAGGTKSWITESRFIGGRIIRLFVTGVSYRHNHLKFRDNTFEERFVELHFDNAATIRVEGARFENTSAAPGIYFGPLTYGITIEGTWSGAGNPRGQFYVSIPKVDLGMGNSVQTASSAEWDNTQAFALDGTSLILANATASVAASSSVNPQAWENLPRALIKPSLGGFTTQANRVIAMSDLIPVRLGDVVEFSADFDGALLRPIVVCLDANQNPLKVVGAGGSFYDHPGFTLNTSTGGYRPATDITAASLALAPTGAVIRSEVKFVRIGAYSATGGFFRSLSGSIWTQPLGRATTRSSAKPIDIARTLAGQPMQGFAPLGFTVRDSVGRRNWTVTDEGKAQNVGALTAGATSATVDAAGTIANGYRAGLLMDNGDTHWTPVSGLSGATFTIDAVPAGRSIADGARVVFNRWETDILTFAAGITPGTIAAGATWVDPTPRSIPGAALGDTVTVGYSLDQQGAVFTGQISAADTGQLRVTNLSGSPITFAAGGITRWRVTKQ